MEHSGKELPVNEKFFALPEEKQHRIMNAGYRIFSRNSYKKSPVGEIAAEAGISKSLLFHYFHNKKELYLFLWEEACNMTKRVLEEEKCYDPDDLFEMMYRGMRGKLQLMRKYPDLTAFVMKAFYEREPEIAEEIQKSYQSHFNGKARNAILQLNKDNFREGLDLGMMYQQMYWASEGYLWEEIQKGPLDTDKLEKDFLKLMEFWKSVYLK